MASPRYKYTLPPARVPANTITLSVTTAVAVAIATFATFFRFHVQSNGCYFKWETSSSTTITSSDNGWHKFFQSGMTYDIELADKDNGGSTILFTHFSLLAQAGTSTVLIEQVRAID